jgi:hypothetical protein
LGSDDLSSLHESQVAVAGRFGAKPSALRWDDTVGVARNLRDPDSWPVNGLRHPPEGGTTGRYLWSGDELSDDPDYFVPLHARHLIEWRPDVLPYLLLPPGWRFLIAPGYEDVWEDPALLEVD